MEILTLVTLIVIGAYILRARDQSRRIALLGSHLGKYQIERLMESLTEGYLRCLGEDDPERRAQIWRLLNTTEEALATQFNSFVADFSRLAEADTRVSRLAVAVPYADRLFPALTFDARRVFAIHAQGIDSAAKNSLGRPPKSNAFLMSAELFLMQHTCHWFCRSKTVASARMLARHKTSYAQLIDAVAPETRRAYCALIGAHDAPSRM
ncbi:hypothetical protein [Variovorax sp. PBL-E5]|uniref:hypothetical protein n=1 Tax=Variovorax sp. PBL-E5 TaxID=434014 RepID=UPI001316510C|nr:hypothetical protein [Variovorax sp. PBL-E5]VTU32975.1 hypothetical protein E5CHR_03524 [Variovorax sp. PBL-E5]